MKKWVKCQLFDDGHLSEHGADSLQLLLFRMLVGVYSALTPAGCYVTFNKLKLKRDTNKKAN